MKPILITFTAILLSGTLFSQQGRMLIDGEIVRYVVDDCGDTLYIATLDDISVSSPQKFGSKEDYYKYLKYRRYAVKVYPFATEAIRIFREVDYATEYMRKGERKRFVKKKQKELEKEFEEPLKKLTKTQGKILVKMIEKELDRSMYDLIKGLRGTITASYWSTFASMFGHKLKHKYTTGDDPILDAVLQDLDISYDLSKN